MQKDAFFFTHDSNAKDDPKIILLIEQLGLEGYGIFWVLIETLRDQPGYKYPLSLLPAIARRYNTTFEKMKVVVSNYGLFTVTDDSFFFSESLMRRMAQWDYKRQLASIAGKASAAKRLALNAGSSAVERPLNDSSTIILKEKKKNDTNNKYTAEFELFYSEYPNPQDKCRTFTNWKTQLKHYTVEQLMAACRNYKKAKAGIDKQYMKSSANFLGNQKPFEDYLGGDTNAGPTSDNKELTIEELIKLHPGVPTYKIREHHLQMQNLQRS